MTDDDWMAARCGNLDILFREIATGALSSDELAAALSVGAQYGSRELIGAVLALGVSPDLCVTPGDETALHSAVEHSQIGAIRELAAWGADVNAADRSGKTPLHHAVELIGDVRSQGDTMGLEVLEVLLELGADRRRRDRAGRTPWDWADAGGVDDALPLLKND
jgi:ankyrin repeat protein